MLNNDEIVNKLQTIISQLQISSSNQIDVERLNQTELELERILSQLQFELTNARMESNWQQANKLREAYKECQNALDSVRSAIMRSTIIGMNQENLHEMQKILDDVQTASTTQRRIDFIISSLRFVKRLFT
ncbi:hypothetical protein Nos7524_0257 [Nostoc sp. PCC 7524]|jgi:vacuolar-type H+-ATPase subunit E/Vma4|uniref:hypothetical protein n=1 Tax=Nostoc sp. (strain ATCC 29411 / PCC 7524) TaxID=28072 RepID=UPI00029F35AD|nr:hypothetical protein [Nostoc sp. PCC 7524]AFY46179.1 hypothetical protein Nos7524_0257 [Nostoc sp. PCC 7524]